MRARPGTRRRTRIAAASAVIAGVAAGALVAGTAAQASWTPITTLTAPNWVGDSAVISVDKSGDFLAAWSGMNGAHPSCTWQTQIRIRYRTGRLGSVEQLTPCGPWTSFPVVASNASGYGIAAWISSTDTIQARTISPAGKLGPLLTVTPKYNQASLVNVGMSPTGQALVVWQGRQLQGTVPAQILGRFISPASKLGPLLGIGGGTGQLPHVVFDKTGTATVGWSEDFWSKSMVRRVTPSGVGKQAVILATTPADASYTTFGVPLVADDSNGDTFVLTVMYISGKSSRSEHLVLRKWSKSGALGPAITVGTAVPTITTTNLGDGPALGVDGAGNAVVAWDSYLTSTQAAVWGRRVSSAGKLGPSVRLGTGHLPEVAVDPAGAGLITWQPVPFYSPYPGKIYGRRVSARTGTFGAQFELTGDGGYANIAVDPAGEFGVIWVKSSIGSFIQARFGP